MSVEAVNQLYELQGSGDSVATINPMISLKEDHDEHTCGFCNGRDWSFDSARTLPDGRVVEA